MEARLSATDLACRRGERVLFRGLSFALGAGDALQIVGPNGTGKSSLIRILAGLLRPVAGTVDRNVEVALLDERLALDGHLPLGRAFDFWGRIDGVRYGGGSGAPAPSTTSWSPSPVNGGGLGLDDLAEVPVRYLSTGQRKRAAILQSNVRNAGLWLLDEPLNGLDARAAADFQGQIADYLARGGMAVLASHQPFDVPRLARLELAGFAP